MISRKGFTLIELMVVIFIVGILAAVAIPIMRGRIDSAKWSEGKAAAGSIRTAARAFCAERGPTWGAANYAATTLCDLGFSLRSCPTPALVSDLDGKYFSEESYRCALSDYDVYTITVTALSSTRTEKPTVPATVTLDNAGLFVEN
jgi:prepilin-type N-terminal cleavage/methylation domain-containing protein